METIRVLGDLWHKIRSHNKLDSLYLYAWILICLSSQSQTLCLRREYVGREYQDLSLESLLTRLLCELERAQQNESEEKCSLSNWSWIISAGCGRMEWSRFIRCRAVFHKLGYMASSPVSKWSSLETRNLCITRSHCFLLLWICRRSIYQLSGKILARKRKSLGFLKG